MKNPRGPTRAIAAPPGSWRAPADATPPAKCDGFGGGRTSYIYGCRRASSQHRVAPSPQHGSPPRCASCPLRCPLVSACISCMCTCCHFNAMGDRVFCGLISSESRACDITIGLPHTYMLRRSAATPFPDIQFTTIPCQGEWRDRCQLQRRPIHLPLLLLLQRISALHLHRRADCQRQHPHLLRRKHLPRHRPAGAQVLARPEQDRDKLM